MTGEYSGQAQVTAGLTARLLYSLHTIVTKSLASLSKWEKMYYSEVPFSCNPTKLTCSLLKKIQSIIYKSYNL